ncbi:MAG: sigma-70 family RNA polymerase sigma factor [Candidatus Hydrogenedentales bacterium]|jgi:RNA polymerase sigma-70 factor (ECF subfamily)
MFRTKTIGDGAIVRRVLAGRREDYGELVRRHLPAAFAVAVALTGNRTDAEDVSQESFLKAFQSLHTLREPHKFAAWLVSIVRFAAYDFRRTRSLTARVESKFETAEPVVLPEMEKREMRSLVHEQIDHLEDELKEVLLLHYFTGQNSKVIAELLGISPEAVRKRMQRAREALGERLLATLGKEPELEPLLKKREMRIVGAILAAPCPWATSATGGAAAHAGTSFSSLLELSTAKIMGGILIVAACLAAWHVSTTRNDASSQLAVTPAGMEGRGAFATTNDVQEAGPPPEQSIDTSALVSELAKAVEMSQNVTAQHGVIRGRVVDASGAPASGADVSLWQAFRGDNWVTRREGKAKSQTANEAGIFEFGGLNHSEVFPYTSEYIVVAQTDHGFSWAHTSLEPESPEQDVTLRLEPSASLSGRVVDGNRNGIAGAEVYPKQRLEGDEITYYVAPALAVVTNANGTFNFPALWEGRWNFDVRAPGFAATTSDYFITGTSGNTIPMEQGIVALGRVVRADTRQPIPNVEVRLFPKRSIEKTEVTTDAEGKFRFADLDNTAYEVSLHDDNWVLAEGPALFYAEPGTKMNEIVLQAAQGAVVEGRLIDAETGAGIPDIRVIMEDREIHCASFSKKSGADGRFKVSGLAAGSYVVSYDHPKGYPAYELHTDPDITVEFGQMVRDYTIALSKDPSISGKVIDAKGQPLKGVHLWALAAPDHQQYCDSAEDGTFVLSGYAPGTDVLTVRVEKQGLAAAPAGPLTIPDGGLKNLSFTMDREAVVEGTVTDADGIPLERAGVMLQSKEVPDGIMSDTTRLDGTFTVKGLFASTYDVRVSPRTEDAQSSSVPAGEPITVQAGQHLTGVRLVPEAPVESEESESTPSTL